ncbi:MAG TPA: hypothetical protein VML55_26410 [Planctomycetaceae bacterium]|nr:hypothetical protein [Planctomycetaceae bacterium]
MFGFLFHRKRQEVRKALASRINHRCADQLRHTSRATTRSPFCEVVWLIPDVSDLSEAFDEMMPVVSKDISTQGVSLIHTQPAASRRVVIGLEGQHGPSFIRATVEHSTPLGYGFYQIGLSPEEVLHAAPGELARWRSRLREYGAREAEQPVAVGC